MDDMYFKKYAFSISVVISGPHIDFSNVKTQEQIETITKALESSKYIDQNLTESWLRDFLDYIKRNEVCMYNNPSSNKISHKMILSTAYQYRNLLGRILLLAKMMIIVNHDSHKYKYEFKKKF